jgi:hypothetical protein
MKDENKHAAWAIIGEGVDEFFMPKDAFVCVLCAGKVRYAQSVSNRSDPRPEPEPEPTVCQRWCQHAPCGLAEHRFGRHEPKLVQGAKSHARP